MCFIISPSAYATKMLIPGGEVVGISINSDGLLITQTMTVTDENGKKVCPADNADIRPGDRLFAVDGVHVNSAQQLLNYVQGKKNDIAVTLKRDNEDINTVVRPVLSGDCYKLGIKVKEGASGIGTMTFIDPKTKTFAALGHGISDIDTNSLIKCKSGKILTCSLSEPKKGKKGDPGELNGVLGSEVLGSFTKNTPNGLFGEVESLTMFNTKDAVAIADFSDIKTGDAYILSDLDGHGVLKYKIEIKKAEKGNLDGKNIVFKVTDSNLIDKTGGIVQGMSGSPIIQNGKLVGAVTHVFVNDPTRGYGIFIENMLEVA